MSEYVDIMNNFNLDNLPDLDQAVLASLEMIRDRTVPRLDVTAYTRPLVVGSGNAEATGRIIFAESDAIYASESSVDDKLASIDTIGEVVVISASGGKHAPIIARKARAAGKHVTLITSTADSPTSRELDASELTTHVFPKNREPYTYNTSTYMAMIAGHTGEDAGTILDYIMNTIDRLELKDFRQFDKYYLIVPARFSGIIRMLQVKFIELFGRNIARDIESSEYVRHATTVAPSDELFITFGDANNTWGAPENRLDIPLPENAGYVAMMAIGYYLVGQIQKAKPQYFKENIAGYCQFISGVFAEEIEPIVAGN